MTEPEQLTTGPHEAFFWNISERQWLKATGYSKNGYPVTSKMNYGELENFSFKTTSCGLSRSNLPPEVNCPGDKLLRSKLSPGHFTSKQTVRPVHVTSKESDPLRSRLSLLQGDILLK